MASTRLILGLGVALSLLAAPALAQSPAKQADTLNEQGKALSRAKKYDQASDKFRQAIVLSPEGRFYLNLCMSLYQAGKIGEANTACRAVKDHGATGQQVGQAQTIIDKFIAPQMREAGLDPETGNPINGNPDNGNPINGNPDNGNPNGNPDNGNPNGNPDNGNPNGNPDNGNPNGNPSGNPNSGNNLTVAPPPSLFDQMANKPAHEYTWSLGAQLLGMSTSIGRKEDWNNGTGGLRIVSDYALSRNRQFGAQGHLTFFGVTGNEDIGNMESITAFDLGASVYKELCKGRACVKPLIGAQVGLYSVDQDNQFAVLGVRGELGLEYALGARYENVLTVALGFDGFLPAQESDNGADPATFGLDRASSNVYLGLGFTRRFNSPLGSSPMFSMQ